MSKPKVAKCQPTEQGNLSNGPGGAPPLPLAVDVGAHDAAGDDAANNDDEDGPARQYCERRRMACIQEFCKLIASMEAAGQSCRIISRSVAPNQPYRVVGEMGLSANMVLHWACGASLTRSS
jgi:hypothetical protein